MCKVRIVNRLARTPYGPGGAEANDIHKALESVYLAEIFLSIDVTQARSPFKARKFKLRAGAA